MYAREKYGRASSPRPSASRHSRELLVDVPVHLAFRLQLRGERLLLRESLLDPAEGAQAASHAPAGDPHRFAVPSRLRSSRATWKSASAWS